MLYYGYKNEEVSVLETDITRKDIIEKICIEIKDQTVDLIVGGPPLPSFSSLGRAKDEKGMVNDPRNFLLKVMLKY
ncbi:MAG: DNA cytosine methyltransferase [Ignavibacteria bacterium]|nr:DNA cytosine methyltransferase [Ignavibacteria bacterium]